MVAEVITSLQENINKIQKELSEMQRKIKSLSDKEITTKPLASPPKLEFDELAEFLKNNNDWPNAVSSNLICDISSEQDKQDRAEGILDIIVDSHLENLKFLDFGCGEGHVIQKAKSQNPKLAVGYDIAKFENWTEFEDEKAKFDTNWENIVANKPYNAILLYDVIDHILDEDPVSVMRKVKSVLAPNGKVFVRCHPFCSRHATHIYQKINKAYIHLIFTEEELNSLGYQTIQKVHKVIHPLMFYGNLFSQAGLTPVGQPQIQKEPVEQFFVRNKIIADRIKSNWRDSSNEGLRSGKNFPFAQLEQQFLDYVLV